jgi:hypothetical protein
MTEQVEEDQLDASELDTPQPDTKPRGRIGKAIFLIIMLVVVVIIVRKNQTLPPPTGWIDNDLEGALVTGKDEDRNVLILFVQSPPSELDTRLQDTTLRKSNNLKAIKDRNLVPVMVRVGRKNRGDLFERYDLQRDDLPAMILLDPSGTELARHNGFIGELNFRDQFLHGALD